MSETLQRKKRRLNIKILEENTSELNPDIRCVNCKEWQYMIHRQGDNNNLFCGKCGSLTPLRVLKHGRGLAAPAIQQPTSANGIIQPKGIELARHRRPTGIHKPYDPLVESLIRKGFQIIDSQYIEPLWSQTSAVKSFRLALRIRLFSISRTKADIWYQ